VASERTKRDQSRRLARARAAGFESDYQYRVRGTKQGSRARAEARGHGGNIRSFLAFLKPNDTVMCDIRSVERDGKGKYVLIEKTVIPPLNSRRDPREFELRDLTRARLVRLIGQEEARGVRFSPSPSLDQRRLVSEEELTS
jgi:hypothetical protein